ADLGRKLRSILAYGKQVADRSAHLAHAWIVRIAEPMTGVCGSQPFRDQALDGGAEQLCLLEAEQLCCRAVGQHDGAGVVHDQQRVGSELDEILEQRTGMLRSGHGRSWGSAPLRCLCGWLPR